ncbi:hypothetical protein FNV43_RR27065 [Rhamnella rubrinervis]|uniref:Uncharacterized protein n=1 Tax=Rhamnella rubrinervis TaxID=2594499 RepID=A0A8K0GS64_9ROSA|nr:hypothetical protein FNV43_RR27065 [Rhamnella rubrinervis]
MDSKKSNKIREIVRLQQILKKWKKLANAPKNTSSGTNINISAGNTNSSSRKSMKFLKRTLSFTDMVSIGASSNSNNDIVPKGFLAVCVGKELKRYIIPTEYLGHQAFGILLQEAEDEFGFQQEGVLKIPCDVPVFENILKVVEHKSSSDVFFLHDHFGFNHSADKDKISCCSSPSDSDRTPSHHPQMCR